MQAVGSLPPAPATTWWRRRGISVATGSVLVVEAVASPFIWWGAIIVGAFVGLDRHGRSTLPLLDGMARLGSWGPLVPLAILFGAAIVMLTRPSKGRALSALLCAGAGLLNLGPGLALAVYNIGISVGPLAWRAVGLLLGAAFLLISVRLLMEAVALVRPTTSAALPPAPKVFAPLV